MTNIMTSIEDIWNVVDQLQEAARGTTEIETRIDTSLCKNCKKSGFFREDVCTNCGFTSNIHIHEGAEWTSGVSEDGVAHDPSRVGMASNSLYSSQWGVSTVMNVKRGQHKKYALASKINYHGGMNHRDRALHKAYAEFDRAGKIVLSLPDAIVVKAKHMYKEMAEKLLTRGSVRDGVKANCLFLACKESGVPRSTQEIADAFDIQTKDISRTSDRVRDIVNPQKNKITMPADIVPRIFMGLDLFMNRELSIKKMRCMRECAALTKCSKLAGKTPGAVAAVVVMHELGLSKQEVAKAAGVSTATITKIDNIVKDWNSK